MALSERVLYLFLGEIRIPLWHKSSIVYVPAIQAVDYVAAYPVCSRSYWKPSVMGDHLEQAAKFARSRESTLNITDSVSVQYNY